MPVPGVEIPVWRTALALLAIGMLDPDGTRMEEMESEGVDMIALDVSRSMLAEDVGMARLDLAKRSIERVVQQLDGDVGLMVRRRSLCAAPDAGWLPSFLDAIGTGDPCRVRRRCRLGPGRRLI